VTHAASATVLQCMALRRLNRRGAHPAAFDLLAAASTAYCETFPNTSSRSRHDHYAQHRTSPPLSSHSDKSPDSPGRFSPGIEGVRGGIADDLIVTFEN
jgi:hypothetical protein